MLQTWLFKILLSIVLGIYPKVEMLNHMIILRLTFWETTILISSANISFYIPTKSAQGFGFSKSAQHLFFFIVAILTDDLFVVSLCLDLNCQGGQWQLSWTVEFWKTCEQWECLLCPLSELEFGHHISNSSTGCMGLKPNPKWPLEAWPVACHIPHVSPQLVLGLPRAGNKATQKDRCGSSCPGLCSKCSIWLVVIAGRVRVWGPHHRAGMHDC